MSLTTATPGYTALRERAAWVNLSARGKIRMTGEDRLRLLHAMTTQQVQDLRPGQGAYAFFLNAQGRILADVNVLCFEDHVLLDTEPEQRTNVYEHLDRYIIADDVALEDVTDEVRTIDIEGPEAAQVLAALGAPVPSELYSHAAWGEGTVQHLTGRFRLIGDVPPLTGLPEADDEEARTVRMEHARARYGDDFSEKHLVQETALLHAVHFRKGCYLGQEIVERVRSRGQVHKLLRLVELDTQDAPPIGAKLTRDGEEAGEVVSSAYSPALAKTLAMAYMKTPLADTGTAVQFNGVNGRVRSLPQA